MRQQTWVTQLGSRFQRQSYLPDSGDKNIHHTVLLLGFALKRFGAVLTDVSETQTHRRNADDAEVT